MREPTIKVDTSGAKPAAAEAANGAAKGQSRRFNTVRAAVLITGAAKYRRLSTLHEQEARLWTLLVRHTAEPVHRRAATDAQCAARARAREYAEFAQHWPALDAEPAGRTP